MEIISTVSTRKFKPRVFKPRKASKRPLKRTKKEKTTSQLVKELDALVSRFVRLQASDKDGMCPCYTCGKQFHYKKIHCGHYMSRFYKASRWNLNNLRPQCMMCNLWKRGDPVVFRENLVKELGEAAVREIEQSRHISTKLEKDWLLSEITRYKHRSQDS